VASWQGVGPILTPPPAVSISSPGDNAAHARRRIVGRDWPLPEPVRERMRGLLEPLGFELRRPILVSEPEDENALEFRQDDGGDGD